MAEAPKLTIQIGNEAADDRSIKIPPPGRITLSPEARRRLVEALPYDRVDLEGTGADDKRWLEDPDDPDWVRLEDALLEILMPVRYVTGVPTSRQLHEDTQANEAHGLTPLPLHEQVPGAWNFKEPRP